MYKNNIVHRIFTIVLFSLFCFQSFAENWNIPAVASAKNSYIQFTVTTAKEGDAIFTQNCMSCHGNPGKGNGLKSFNPAPPDLAGTITQKRTDGDLFYIITTGKIIMPSFATVLSVEQRWKVISFIRSFNKNYVQVVSKKINLAKSNLVKLNILYDSKTHIVRVQVTANEPSGVVLLKKSEVSLYVKRYFGQLQIEKTIKTDNNGVAEFNFPTDLPGVKLNDDNYGEKEIQNNYKIGVPTDKPSLTEKRAIWNVMAKAPIWLLLTYSFCLMIVLSVFLYIFYSLYKLRKTGEIKN
jgi:mono/diheme cytochrome c family protein